MALYVWARFYFICDMYMCLVLMFLHDNVGGEHGTEEAKDWFRWRLCLVWVHVLAIYSKCESQKWERKGMELLSTFTKKKKNLLIHQTLLFFNFHKVISETLRMANIINGVWRKALKDVEIKGQFLENAIFLGLCFLADMIVKLQANSFMIVNRLLHTTRMVCPGIFYFCSHEWRQLWKPIWV